MIEDNLCPIKDDCLFYQKPYYHSPTEKTFLVKYCLKGGGNCGMKRHHDISERLKRMETKNFPRDKKTWRSK